MRHALKSLLQTPKTTFVVVSTLALAVALVTTVFSALNAYAWRALPYPDPSRIVAIGVEQTPYAGRLGSVHRQDLLRIREMEDAFTRVAAYTLLHPSLRGDGPAYRAPVVAADGDLLPLLGAVPARGRVLVDDDENVVVLSHTGWVRRFGGRADVIGGTLHVEGRPHVVIGVLEERFGFENAEAFVPLRSTGEAAHVSVLARLAGGVSPGQAAAWCRTRCSSVRASSASAWRSAHRRSASRGRWSAAGSA